MKTRKRRRKTKTVTIPDSSHLRRASVAIALLAAIVALSLPARAQREAKDYALIFGTVWGPDNYPVYGVPIKIRRADQKKAKWQLTSDHNGEFAQRVPVGKAEYIVWADIKRPKGQPPIETKVQIEFNERVDIGLHLPAAPGKK